MRASNSLLWLIIILVTGFLAGISVLTSGCELGDDDKEPTSRTGVQAITASIETGSDGLTVEQRNVRRRLEIDNDPGAVKHLYIISAYSGEVLIYSTVKGKVSSSGKRLSPYSVTAQDGQYVGNDFNGFPIDVGGRSLRTGEVLQDDGTFGNSIPYIFWFDANDEYHQHYPGGGQIIHLASQPMQFPRVIVTIAPVDANTGEPINNNGSEEE